MRKSVYAMLFSACLALPVAAQEAPIQKTIQSQIDAFLADDFARAFTFASPNIKGIFGTPENFGAMVKKRLSDGLPPLGGRDAGPARRGG